MDGSVLSYIYAMFMQFGLAVMLCMLRNIIQSQLNGNKVFCVYSDLQTDVLPPA